MIQGPPSIRPPPSGGNLPVVSGPAEIRGYVDFQLLLSRLLPQPPAPHAAAAPVAEQDAAADGDQAEFLARLQLELAERLHRGTAPLDRLGLALLADACDACARLRPPPAPLPDATVRFPWQVRGGAQRP